MISKIKINKVIDGNLQVANDSLAVEEPLEIRISYVKDFQRTEKNISITMRTPGEDKALAIGFLFTEGIIDGFDRVKEVTLPMENTVIVTLKDNVDVDLKRLERNFYTTSSCGVCGKSSIDALITTKNVKRDSTNSTFHSSLIQRLPGILRNQQDVFEQTGGLHASAIFDVDGKLLLLKEDVGRHNALDKLIGTALMENLFPLNNFILLLSGRASFELIQKAVMAGIQTVAAIGAPSSLAVELAKENQMILIGFLKYDKFNIYCGEERIFLD